LISLAFSAHIFVDKAKKNPAVAGSFADVFLVKAHPFPLIFIL